MFQDRSAVHHDRGSFGNFVTDCLVRTSTGTSLFAMVFLEIAVALCPPFSEVCVEDPKLRTIENP